jgi:hypothetical protein
MLGEGVVKNFRIEEIPGNHCDVCHRGPVRAGFYARLCRRFHGYEFVCPECLPRLRVVFGSRALEYMFENDGCLFEELRLAEDRVRRAWEKEDVEGRRV